MTEHWVCPAPACPTGAAAVSRSGREEWAALGNITGSKRTSTGLPQHPRSFSEFKVATTGTVFQLQSAFLVEEVAALTNFGFCVPDASTGCKPRCCCCWVCPRAVVSGAASGDAMGGVRRGDFNLLVVNPHDYTPVTLGLPRKSFASSCSTSFFRGLKNSPGGTCMGSNNSRS